MVCQFDYFCCEVQLLRLVMEYYFIQMASAASLTVSHSTEIVFVQFFICMRSNLDNGFTNIGLLMFN